MAENWGVHAKLIYKTVYIQCKGDIMVVDIEQHKSKFKNSNFTITQQSSSDIV